MTTSNLDKTKYLISVLPGLEGRLVHISENIKLKYSYIGEEKQFNGKLFVLSQFPLLEDTWEITKIIKNMLDDYVTNLEGNGWYVESLHVESLESFNNNDNIKNNKSKIELLNTFMENDDLEDMYKYIINIKFKTENILALRKENKLLKEEIENLKEELKEANKAINNIKQIKESIEDKDE